ncbi:hypothetical protein ACFQXB_02470 [Plastorhodobacter daqingensis]|uniref:ABC transporter substrate-binding protein n=1 Tax=Plastorhodobacter daqingensis TaxID=1387281 RepID=A0ABW2UHW8_9RHOB
MNRFLSAALAVPLALGAQAAAAEGICGQPAALTSGAPLPLAAGFAALQHDLRLVRGEPRYIDFTMTQAQALTLRTQARDGADPVLVLYGADGQMVDYDDDSAGGLDALLTVSLQPGGYCAQVRLLGGIQDEAAAVVLSLEPAGQEGPAPTAPEAPLSPAGACASAQEMGRLGSTGRLEHEDAALPNAPRAHRLVLTEPVMLQIDAQSEAFDTVLTVSDENGLFLENDDHEGTDSRISLQAGPGTLCLGVRAYGEGSGGPYRLSAAVQDPAEVLRTAVDAGEAIPGADSDVTIEALGPLGQSARTTAVTAGRTHWSSFSLTEPSLVLVQGSTLSDSFTLALFAADGRLIARQYGEGALSVSKIAEELPPGDYLVAQTVMQESPDLKIRQVVLNRFVRPAE